jgi:DNA-binding CsgD family transcriptional regulator
MTDRIYPELGDLGLVMAAYKALAEMHVGAAFLVTETGSILVENKLGREALQRDRQSTMGALIACIQRRAPRPTFKISEVSFPSNQKYFVASEIVPHRASDHRLSEARAAWKLTRREADVLSLVVEGHLNKTIADRLSCAIGTVEVHMTHLLRKASVDNRTELVAKFWTRPGEES